MSKQQELSGVLDRLRNAVPEIRGALVASSDGLAVAESLSSGEDVNRIAAMAAAALGLGKRITTTLSAGNLTKTQVSGTDAQIFLYSIGDKGVLAIIASSDANVGLINLEARDAANNIGAVL